jgi:hypothetical protein
MKKQNLFGLVLATSVALTSLAGCNAPMQPQLGTGSGNGGTTATQPGAQPAKPGSNVQLAPAKQQAATANTQATAEAMADAREMDAYDTMANQEETAARYSVSALRADGSVVVAEDGMMVITADGGKGGKGTKAGTRVEAEIKFKGKLKDAVKKKLTERQAKLTEKQAKTLDKLKGDRDKLKGKAQQAKWVANGDGTETKTFSFETSRTVNGKTMSRSVKMERTRNAESKDLLKSHVEFSQALPNGLTRSSVRDKVVAEDGTATVTFHSEITFKDGTKRVADWAKTISADGAVTGTGTIVWSDKDGKVVKTVNVTLGGTEETETATAVDPTTQTESEVTASVDGTVDAEITDAATGTTVEADAAATTTTETTGDTAAAPTQGIAVGEPTPGADPAGTFEEGSADADKSDTPETDTEDEAEDDDDADA